MWRQRKVDCLVEYIQKCLNNNQRVGSGLSVGYATICGS
jgi:hypothetical protein